MPWAAVAGAAASAVIGSALAPDAPDQTASNNANNAAAEAAKQQAAIAQDQWNTYKKTYQPLEEQFVQQAKDTSSIANQNKSAQEAAATTAASYASARDRLNKMPGANPSSEGYLRATNDLALAEAAGSASGQTAARQTAKDKGNAMITDALSLGKGLPATASSALSSAAAGSLSAGNANFNQQQQTYQNGVSAANGLGKAVGGVFQSKKAQDWMNGTTTDSSMPMTNGGGFTNTPNYLIVD